MIETASISERKTERGLQRTATGWAFVERTTGIASGEGPVVLRARVLAGPFSGTGAKVRAIRAAGTNRVIV